MTTQEEFLAKLAALLRDCGIAFMVSGSVASSIHGNPRATNDIDLVIDPSTKSLDRFLKAIPNDWYVSSEAPMQAMRSRTMFNVIDAANAFKADLIIRKDRPFSAKEFSRQEVTDVLGSRLPVVTVEDSILSKLEWSRESGSQNQYNDALAIAIVNWTRLDRNYLKEWAGQLRVSEQLDQLLAEVDRKTK